MILAYITISIMYLSVFLLVWLIKSNKTKVAWILLTVISVLSLFFLIYNIFEAFSTVEGFGEFLQEYGLIGLIALILKSGFVLIPTALHLIVIIIWKRKIKIQKEELQKMNRVDIQ